MDRDDGIGVTRQVSEYAAALTYDALPPELVELTKQIVLDTLGVAMGASGLAPEARILADYVEALGGRPESSVLGFGFKGAGAVGRLRQWQPRPHARLRRCRRRRPCRHRHRAGRVRCRREVAAACPAAT